MCRWFLNAVPATMRLRKALRFSQGPQRRCAVSNLPPALFQTEEKMASNIYFAARSKRNPHKNTQAMKTQPNQEGILGERLVSDGLAKLSPAYYHLDNLVVPVNNCTGQTTQIDHIVGSPFGIFVIETKEFRGAVLGGERDRLWFQILGGRRFPFRNPLDQNGHHVSILAQHLRLPSIAFNSVVAFVGLTQLLSPQLPPNVITTIAPGVPGLRRYIEQITQPILSHEELSTATANLIELKGNGLTIEDHIRSIRNRDLSRRLGKAMRLRRNSQSEKLD